MADSHVCAKCGTSIPPGSSFCPRCGTKIPIDEILADTDPMMVPLAPVAKVVATAPPAPPPAAPSAARPAPGYAPPPPRGSVPVAPLAVQSARPWWVFGLPIAIIACGLIIWAVLAGMPFSRKEGKLVRAATPARDTVGEGGGETATVSQLGEPGGVQSTTPPSTTFSPSTVDNTATTTLNIPTQPRPQAQPGTPVNPPMSAPIFVPQPSPQQQPAPGSMSSPRATAPPIQRTVPSAPAPVTTAPMRPAPVTPEPVQQPPRAAQISEEDAVTRVKSFVMSNKSYDIPSDCVDVRSQGYRNVGYTVNVLDLCGPEPRSIGHWRVDALTRELFRQNSSGRFVRP